MKSVGFMPRKPGTSRAHFRDYYENNHAVLAAPLFPFTRYRRNHIVDARIEPGFDGLSEFWADDFAPIGDLMAGEVGATMRKDELNFLDQPRIIAALSNPVLTDADDGDTLIFVKRDGGSDDALIAACRAAGASLDLLTPMGEAAPPYDAVIRIGDTAPDLPDGWTDPLRVTVERAETDMAAAHR